MTHSPERDWQIVVGLSVAVAVCFAVFAYLFFQKVNNGEIFQVEKKAADTSKVFDVVELKKVTDDYTAKKVRFDQLHLRATKMVDPSI